MPKKYLLYIHNDRFAAEPKKSELVNTLLDDWYSHIKNPVIEPKMKKVVVETSKQAKDIVSESVCSGTHDNFRSFCGRKDCNYV